MEALLSHIRPEQVIFDCCLAQSENSEIFLVKIDDRNCVMKVFHDYGPVGFALERYYETDIFKCERDAMKRLKKAGLHNTGIVPEYYGCIERLDPTQWAGELDNFVEDECLPNAVFMEYIENMQEVDLTNFSEKRMTLHMKGMEDIHRAGVIHDDVNPRNMMFVLGDEERVLWIDFDRAQTFDQDDPTPEFRQWLQDEKEDILLLAKALKEDSKKGKMTARTITYFT